MAELQPILAQAAPPLNESFVEYRDVPGFPGYRVGSDGVILSNHQSRGREWRVLKQTIDRYGYAYVALMDAEGRKSRRYAHTLVLEAFRGPRPDGMEALHGPDSTPTNNAAANLRWGTRTENINDAVRAGAWCTHRGHRKSKLVAAEVLMIRELCKRHPGNSGVQAFLAKWFGVTSGIISEIHTRKRWAHV